VKGNQKAEGRRQKVEGGRQKAEGRRQKSEIRNQKSDNGKRNPRQQPSSSVFWLLLYLLSAF
jgi:hypothetical protein